MWLIAITRKTYAAASRNQLGGRHHAGVGIAYDLVFAVDRRAKSYRPPIQQLRHSQSAVLQRIAAREECVSISPQHFEARHAWQQYAALPYQTEPGRCRYIFAQYNPQQTRPEHTVLWEGARPRSKTEHLVLLQR